ncbi:MULTISPECIES: hypothetical protein [unclassified Leucobacter]|uniref:hypothetical protein n=1 Tax=unclassified Leucobacter TaxID=2621730 RepID=UPI00301605A4
MIQLPVPVQVGSRPAAEWSEIEAKQRELGDSAAPYLREQRRPRIAETQLDWATFGLEPRWIGHDTADCSAALQPSIFHNQGADEFYRFRDGAASRNETALVVSQVESARQKKNAYDSLFGPSDSIHLGRYESSIHAKPLGIGAKISMSPNLSDCDHQLALRLLSLRPAPEWHSLALVGGTIQRDGMRLDIPPQGDLLTVIETGLGEPVVAAWLSPDQVERRYILPAETPWRPVLAWLVEQALPELVPGAMQRARRNLATAPDLITLREKEIRRSLEDLKEEYRERKSRLEVTLEAAEAAAGPVREGLLYGTGDQLAGAVRTVFEFAGITVTDVDELLGDTKNADFLCTYDGRSRLVEVKSATGNPSERIYEDLLRHMREWPFLADATPIDGGALVVNHQLRTAPSQRSPTPFTRKEFLLAQNEPIITSFDLLSRWRNEDWPGIRTLLFGACQEDESNENFSPQIQQASSVSDWRRFWRRK